MSLFNFSMKCYNTGLIIKEAKDKILFRKWIRCIGKCAELSKYKTSDTCFICGNGPSLNKVNFDELDGDTIVLNEHWRVASKYNKRPTYYMIADQDYGDSTLDDRLEGVMKCCPDIPHLMTVKIGPRIEKLFPNHCTNIYYFANIGTCFTKKSNNDFSQIVHGTWNVVSWSILLAAYLGYKDIRLLGCDYSLFATRQMQHMYDVTGENEYTHVCLRDMLYRYSITTHIHYEISAYCRQHGVKVINMTRDTLLDAYEIDENSRY